mmetsp:Transcript_27905/g.82033  ORF Transcript_27905/g.82033 Transcript_27905/m.82033 type:complete len:230 (+) Transcript_27905:1198-1887(+)
MMGTRLQPRSSSMRRMATVESKPSMTGMSQSMRITWMSEFPVGSEAAASRNAATLSTAARPLCAVVTLCPSISSMLRATSMLYSESSAANTLARRSDGRTDTSAAAGLASAPVSTWRVITFCPRPATDCPREGPADTVSDVTRSAESPRSKGPVARCSDAAAAGVAMSMRMLRVAVVPLPGADSRVRLPPMRDARARATAMPVTPRGSPLKTAATSGGGTPEPESFTSQ